MSCIVFSYCCNGLDACIVKDTFNWALKKMHNYKGTVNNIFILTLIKHITGYMYTCYTAIDCSSSAGAKWI